MSRAMGAEWVGGPGVQELWVGKAGGSRCLGLWVGKVGGGVGSLTFNGRAWLELFSSCCAPEFTKADVRLGNFVY